MLFRSFHLFIYFWLCWVFVSVRGLSLVGASGGHSSSRCAGLSLSQPLLLQPFLSVQSSGVKYIHIVVQPSSPSISRTFSSSQTETLDPLNTNSPFPLPAASGDLKVWSPEDWETMEAPKRQGCRKRLQICQGKMNSNFDLWLS